MMMRWKLLGNLYPLNELMENAPWKLPIHKYESMTWDILIRSIAKDHIFKDPNLLMKPQLTLQTPLELPHQEISST